MISADNLVSIFNKYNEIAIIISIGISILISLAGVLPSIFITCANIIFFGPINGFFISLLGETIGGYITFKVYRKNFKNKAKIIENKYKIIKELLNSSGKKAMFLIIEGRIIPFIPSGFVTIASALSNVSDFYFIFATFIGKIPSIFVEVLLSYDFINIKENYIRFIFTIIIIIAVFMINKLRK